MAQTAYGVNDPLAVKLWSKKLAQEALYRTFANRFIGESADSVIQLKSETQKDAGDRITCGLRMLLQGDGVQGDGTLEGNEEALTTYSDNLYIDQLRHAVRSAGRMSEQRVPFSVRQHSLDGLADWYAERVDTAFFNQVCGYTPQTDTRYTGNQAVVAHSANRRKWIDASTKDEDLSNDTFTLAGIDKVVEAARMASPLIRPVKMGGEDYYVMFIHEYQRTDLRAATSNHDWNELQRQALAGGQISDNPIFTGSLGVYNGVILHPTRRVTQGVHSVTGAAVTDVRRAVLCGAQAAMVGYGQGSGPGRYTWVEEMFDYGNQLGVSASCIWGIKKTTFNSEDFGVITLSTSASPA